MNRYIGVKLVLARPMKRGDYNKYRNWPAPEGEDQETTGFLIEYLDGGEANDPRHVGYITWTPADVFKRNYRLTSNKMTFGLAIEAMKKGKKVARSGWNGKGMYLYYVPANAYPPTTVAGRELADKNDGLVNYAAYIAMLTATGEVVPWLASQTDMLAEDWSIVE